jgi:hypothetical protein
VYTLYAIYRCKADISPLPITHTTSVDHLLSAVGVLEALLEVAQTHPLLAESLTAHEARRSEISDLCLNLLLACVTGEYDWEAEMETDHEGAQPSSSSSQTCSRVERVEQTCRLAAAALNMLYALCGRCPTTAALLVATHSKVRMCRTLLQWLWSDEERGGNPLVSYRDLAVGVT